MSYTAQTISNLNELIKTVESGDIDFNPNRFSKKQYLHTGLNLGFGILKDNPNWVKVVEQEALVITLKKPTTIHKIVSVETQEEIKGLSRGQAEIVKTVLDPYKWSSRMMQEGFILIEEKYGKLELQEEEVTELEVYRNWYSLDIANIKRYVQLRIEWITEQQEREVKELEEKLAKKKATIAKLKL